MREFVANLSAVLAILAVVTTPLAAQDWVGRGRLEGKVTNRQGDPVAGAKITLHPPEQPEAGPEPFFSDERGEWSYLGLRGGPWVVEIEAEGYVLSQGEVRVNEFQRVPPVDVTLRPDPYAFIGEGERLLEAGETAQARAKFEQGLEGLDPERQARLQALIGDTWFEEGDSARARAAYEEALPALDAQEAAHVRIKLAETYLEEGDPAAARREYERTLPDLGPEGRRVVMLAIARSHDEAGEREQAIATLEGLLEESPDDPQALQLIADLLSRAGREEEAQAYLDRIPETAELPPDMLLNTGIRQFNEQKYEEALTTFDRVARQDPQMVDTYYYRGLVYLNLGRNAEAKADFQKLLELAPEGPHAAEVREYVRYLESGEAEGS